LLRYTRNDELLFDLRNFVITGMSDRQDVTFTVNGDQRTICVEPRRSLADALREDWALTGTHLGCEHGVCGACTVLVDDQPVRSNRRSGTIMGCNAASVRPAF
jgi:aerobic-type carbon monoxide dehydrogenase small subunit (CoxS/CutS family)